MNRDIFMREILDSQLDYVQNQIDEIEKQLSEIDIKMNLKGGIFLSTLNAASQTAVAKT